MKRIYLIFLISLIVSSCNNKETLTLEEDSISFPVLEYDSEITETLNLNNQDIKIANSREIIFWSKSYQNVRNNLGHIYTEANFKDKKKIISGSGQLINQIQPIYFNNHLCKIESNGSLRCFDLQTKKLDLEIDLKPKNKNKFEILRGGISYFDDKIIYVDAYGQIKLIDIIDKNIIWENDINVPILSSPLIYRGYIYFVSSDNKIYALNFDDGSIEWTFQTISENKKNILTPSLSAIENLVIVPFSNGELISFKYDDGRPIWSENISKVSLVSNFDIKDIIGSPVIDGSNVFTISSNGKLVSTNVINGKTNWSINISGSRTPIISGNVLFVIDSDSRLICINSLNGDIYWISNLKKYRKGNDSKDLNRWNGPFLINNLLYNISYFGELIINSPLNGEILTKENIGIKGLLTQPIILKDTIYISDEKSNVFQYK